MGVIKREREGESSKEINVHQKLGMLLVVNLLLK
jgi:hypothetical protein